MPLVHNESNRYFFIIGNVFLKLEYLKMLFTHFQRSSSCVEEAAPNCHFDIMGYGRLGLGKK